MTMEWLESLSFEDLIEALARGIRDSRKYENRIEQAEKEIKWCKNTIELHKKEMKKNNRYFV